jgi:DNA-binding MarR family transcriptional regulator
VSQRDYEALAGFRHALRGFLRFSEDAAAAVGLTPRQHQALLAVRGAPDRRLNVGALAEGLQVRHHSAVGLVDRLVGLGLLRRRRGREDQRQVFLVLSARGDRLLARLAAVHREELRSVAPRLRTLLAALEAPPPGSAVRGGSRKGPRSARR